MTTNEFLGLHIGDQIKDVKTGDVKTIHGFQDTQYYRIAFTSPALEMKSCVSDMVADGTYQSCTRWMKVEQPEEMDIESAALTEAYAESTEG